MSRLNLFIFGCSSQVISSLTTLFTVLNSVLEEGHIHTLHDTMLSVYLLLRGGNEGVRGGGGVTCISNWYLSVYGTQITNSKVKKCLFWSCIFITR